MQSKNPPNPHAHHEVHGPYSSLHHAYLDSTPLKKSWRAVISARYFFFSVFLVIFQFVPFIQISLILLFNIIYCVMVWKIMPWRKRCEGVVEGVVEGWVIGAGLGFWILCLDDLVMGIVGVEALIENRKGGVIIRNGLRLLSGFKSYPSLTRFRDMNNWNPNTLIGWLAHSLKGFETSIGIWIVDYFNLRESYSGRVLQDDMGGMGVGGRVFVGWWVFFCYLAGIGIAMGVVVRDVVELGEKFLGKWLGWEE